MGFISIIMITVGLVLFEAITSIDNAIINAQGLSTMQQWVKRWPFFWGLLFAVFLVRGLLPWLIVWATVPSLGPIGVLTATFSGNPAITAINKLAFILLIGGGIGALVIRQLTFGNVERINKKVPISEKRGDALHTGSGHVHGTGKFQIAPALLAAASGDLRDRRNILPEIKGREISKLL